MKNSNRNIIAINDPVHICMKCLNKFEDSKMHVMHINALGYGGYFDGFSTKIQLCENCLKETNGDWWKFEKIEDGYCEEYKYEKEIIDFVNTFPIEGQELFFNKFSHGSCCHNIESQDWIDYELGILSHEKCKEYGMYSIQEKQAYKDRFPTCGNVFKKNYKDGVSACYCKYGASGNSDGSCWENISEECYLCNHYVPRKDSIKTINVFDEFIAREKERLNAMLIYATKNLEMINLDPENYFAEHN